MLTSLKDLLKLFPNAVFTGCLVAAVSSLFGVFVILKRVVFISITLSETAACGIAAAMLLGIHPFLGASVLSVLTVAALSADDENARVPRDALLGVIFVGAAGLSILLVSKSGFGLHEVKALLYGDLILSSPGDRNLLVAVALPALLLVCGFLRPILHSFFDREAARVMGIRVVLWEILFFVSLGLVVSAASKVTGAVLVFCYLVVTPSAALLLSRRLWVVLVLAPALSVIATIGGLVLSYHFDLPTNQTVSVAACILFVASALFRGGCRLWRRLSRRN